MAALSPVRMQVLIVTHRPEGIGRVEAMALPRVDGVEYLVSWQASEGAPVPAGLSARDDVHIHRFEGTGVSANRNNLLRLATAPSVLIADDDLRYTPEGLKAVLECIESHPETDYFSFRYTGADNKRYPPCECSLARPPKGFYQTTFEVGLNRQGAARRLRFSEEFGPGARYFTASEDEMLLQTARHMGLVCRFFPLTVACHPALTTGSRKALFGVMRSLGAILALAHPLSWPLRVPLNAYRAARSGRMGFLKALCAIGSGAARGALNRKRLFAGSIDTKA